VNEKELHQAQQTTPVTRSISEDTILWKSSMTISAIIEILDRFHHTGFCAFQGPSVLPGDSVSRDELAVDSLHPPVSLQQKVGGCERRPPERKLPRSALRPRQ